MSYEKVLGIGPRAGKAEVWVAGPRGRVTLIVTAPMTRDAAVACLRAYQAKGWESWLHVSRTLGEAPTLRVVARPVSGTRRRAHARNGFGL